MENSLECKRYCYVDRKPFAVIFQSCKQEESYIYIHVFLNMCKISINEEILISRFAVKLV